MKSEITRSANKLDEQGVIENIIASSDECLRKSGDRDEAMSVGHDGSLHTESRNQQSKTSVRANTEAGLAENTR